MTLKADIIIVGGGCCGVLVACQILHKVTRPVTIILFEKSPRLGEGVAYSTTYKEHILNVPNQAMSAFSQHKDDFVHWLDAHGHASESLGFSPRALYAEYLRDCLQKALQVGAKVGAQLKIVHDEIIEMLPVVNAGWHLVDRSGNSYKAKSVVLALGIFMRLHQSHAVGTSASVAIIGSGLSMADAILKLKHENHQGNITVFSRNGHLPLAHNIKSYSMFNTIDWPLMMSVLQTHKKFKMYFRAYCTNSEYPWQALIDSLRPYTQQLWQNWDNCDKQRFLRHLRSKWDTHRHRVAPQVAVELQQLLKDEFFTIKHAAVINTHSIEHGYLSYYDLSNNVIQAEHFENIIDCAGLINDYTKANSELLQRLFRQEIIVPGPLNRGLRAQPNGKLAEGLYTLGFALHGILWESVAVPELRVQAENIATACLSGCF